MESCVCWRAGWEGELLRSRCDGELLRVGVMELQKAKWDGEILRVTGCNGELLRDGCDGELRRAGCDGDILRAGSDEELV